MNMIWSDPGRFSQDWKANKILHTGKKGYFNLATNYPQLWEEIEKLREAINTFNISRSNLKDYKNKIKSQLPIEELSKGTIKDNIKIETTRDDQTRDHPKIIGWNNNKLIHRISENWKDRKNIEEKLTDEAIKRVKTIDLSEREKSEKKEFLIAVSYTHLTLPTILLV